MTKKRDGKRLDLCDLPDVITPEQLAAVTGQNPNAVRKQCVEGAIPAEKIGTRWYIGKERALGCVIGQPPRRTLLDEVREAVKAGVPVTMTMSDRTVTLQFWPMTTKG